MGSMGRGRFDVEKKGFSEENLLGITFEELDISSYTSINFNQCGYTPNKSNSCRQK